MPGTMTSCPYAACCEALAEGYFSRLQKDASANVKGITGFQARESMYVSSRRIVAAR